MIPLIKACAIAATVFAVPAGLTASSAFGAASSPKTACRASVNLPNVLVLSQAETGRHLVLTTSCPLNLASVTILNATDQEVDAFGWIRLAATTGAVAIWDQYNFDFVAGHTYHTNHGSFGYDDANFHRVTITSRPMVVKNATYVTLSSVTRVRDDVTVTGTTHQWSGSADYGLGQTVRAAESVQIQGKSGSRWVTMKTVRSTVTGKVSATFRATGTRSYRLEVPSAPRLNASTSASRRA